MASRLGNFRIVRFVTRNARLMQSYTAARDSHNRHVKLVAFTATTAAVGYAAYKTLTNATSASQTVQQNDTPKVGPFSTFYWHI